MSSPAKKSVADKEFETKLKRHMIRGKAERLIGNIDSYYQQKNERVEYFDQFSPSKLKTSQSVLLNKRLDKDISRNESHIMIDSLMSKPSKKSDFGSIKI